MGFTICTVNDTQLTTNKQTNQTNQPTYQPTTHPTSGHKWKHNLLGRVN